jgi:Nitroreductase family
VNAQPTRRVGQTIVELAGRAPSIHNTQPWLWRQTADGLELHADPERRLEATDRGGRNLVISCGAALHHAVTAAAALGWRADVERLPEGSSSYLLARIALQRDLPSETAETDLRAIAERCTDRRRFTSWPVPEERLQHLAEAAEREGTHALPLVDVSRRFRAELLVARAAEDQAEDPAVTAEQRSWVDHSAVDGIPSALLPAERRVMSGGMPSRFAGVLVDDRGREVEGSDGLIVLGGSTDGPAAWLAAGEGLSALWLMATTQGLSVVPLSQVVEVESTRRAMAEQVLGGMLQPLILVRIGWQAISRRELPRTMRRPVSELLEQA